MPVLVLLGATLGPLAGLAHADFSDNILDNTSNPYSWAYSPKTIQVAVGDTVTWTNIGTAPHTVTASAFDSGDMQPGQTFTWTAIQSGTFSFYCVYHPWMVGTVTVTDS